MGVDRSVREALEESIRAATHLTAVDDAAVAAARALADKIDAWDVIVAWAVGEASEGSRPAVPQNDNTSLGSFLRYCDALGLTPVSRRSLELKEAGPGGKLAQLRAIQGGKKKSS